MTTPVSEPNHEVAGELWADDELSDEALDRAVGHGGKYRPLTAPPSGMPCARCQVDW